MSTFLIIVISVFIILCGGFIIGIVTGEASGEDFVKFLLVCLVISVAFLILHTLWDWDLL